MLVTGGLGYIGSHCVLELIEKGHSCVIVDNLFNSHIEIYDRIQRHLSDLKCTSKNASYSDVRVTLHVEDICCKISMKRIFETYQRADGRSMIECVIHFAGLKAVGDSFQESYEYYRVNVLGTLILLGSMLDHNVRNIIYSSTATVYGNPKKIPIKETDQIDPLSPYARSKFMVECILEDSSRTLAINVIVLRYFNPIGGHPLGIVGEWPKNTNAPNNLIPYILQVARGKLPRLTVFGDDYDTRDGSGIRDYIHVMDLCSGHISALNHIMSLDNDRQKMTGGFFKIFNLGTGEGYTVFEVVSAFEKIIQGNNIEVCIGQRRSGDVAALVADSTSAKLVLGWSPTMSSLEQMCKDSFSFSIEEGPTPRLNNDLKFN